MIIKPTTHLTSDEEQKRTSPAPVSSRSTMDRLLGRQAQAPSGGAPTGNRMMKRLAGTGAMDVVKNAAGQLGIGTADAAPSAPSTPKNTAELIDMLMSQRDADRAELEKKRSREARMAAIADGLGALHRAYAHARGVAPMPGTGGASKALQERYDKYRVDMDKDYNDRMLNYLKMQEAQRKADNDAMVAKYNQSRLDEQERHNKAMEASRSAWSNYYDEKAETEREKSAIRSAYDNAYGPAYDDGLQAAYSQGYSDEKAVAYAEDYADRAGEAASRSMYEEILAERRQKQKDDHAKARSVIDRNDRSNQGKKSGGTKGSGGTKKSGSPKGSGQTQTKTHQNDPFA